MGYAIAQAINQVAYDWRKPVFTNGDIYDATNNPVGNLLPDGAMTGTSGGLVSVCTGTVVGTNSTYMYLNGVGSPGTCVGSATTLADGRGAQQIIMSGSSTGSNNYVVYRQLLSTPSNIAAGDVLEAQAWVNITGASNIAGVDVVLTTTEGGLNYQNDSSVANQADVFPTAWADATQHILISPRRTVSATPTAVYVDVRIFTVNGSVIPAGTITISSPSLRKVLQ